MLQGKKVLVGVTGSIAAYKAAMLVRLLVKDGAEVRVVMTNAATEFITPLTLSTLSKHPVLTTFVKDNTGAWNNHVELGLWADAIVVAPASANTLAKFANGLCDNLLTAVYLSARCPVFVAPAMDLDMYQHPSTLANLSRLASFGNKIIEATHGELASGLHGQGRLAEPEDILTQLKEFFTQPAADSPLKGKNVLITAGPTYEAIDPVRFIGNHSSGKMGYALAEALAMRGAQVQLVSGPSVQQVHQPGITLTKVKSATEMLQTCQEQFPHSHITIFAAAVADYRPKTVANQKIKKKGEEMTIELVKNPDIAATLGKQKGQGQLTVGFALETNDEEDNARQKLENKNFDLIVLNSLRDAGAGFGHDTNKITLLDRHNKPRSFELKTKEEVAQDIAEAIIQLL